MTAEVRRLAAGVLLPGIAGVELSAQHVAWLQEGLGGVALFGDNIVSPDQVRALTGAIRAANPAAVIAIDEEGGDVTRLHMPEGSPEPGNGVLGRIDDEAVTAASAARIGRELAAVGVTLDLAPDADANTDPDNPVIGVRSFGADPELVARHTAAWTRGLQSTGVAACAKHFPGHGDTAVDSHIGLPVVPHDLDVLRQRELVPFVAAIEAGTAAIMTSHILLPALDPDHVATRSRRILTGLLREELGFAGLIVTDALDMAGALRRGSGTTLRRGSGTTSAGIGIPAAAVEALAAGADLLCLGTVSEPYLDSVLDAIVAAVDDGVLPVERLEEAVGRVRGLAAAGASVPDASADPALAFDVQPEAAAELGRPGPWAVVRLENRPNAAVGVTGWGPFAAVGDDDASRRFASWPTLPLVVDDAVEAPAVDGRVLVIGRDLHRHPHARAVVDRLRAAGTVITVDLGWPSADRRYADVATFGASRAVGAALLDLLTRERENP